MNIEPGMKNSGFFSFYCYPVIFSHRNLPGIWRGHFNLTTAACWRLYGVEDRYKFEIQLDQRNKYFNGVTILIKPRSSRQANCRGQVNDKTNKVMLEG